MNKFEYISISINYNRPPRLERELCTVAMAGASVEVTLLPWKYPEHVCVCVCLVGKVLRKFTSLLSTITTFTVE